MSVRDPECLLDRNGKEMGQLRDRTADIWRDTVVTCAYLSPK